MPQLNIRLNAEDVGKLSVYAATFGLDRTGLANLLLQREIRVRRLSKIRGNHSLSRDNNRPRDEKITAHLPADRLSEFVEIAKREGLSRSAAGAVLLLEELRERWLDTALSK